MSDDPFQAICRGELEPVTAFYLQGKEEHALGKGFHDGPPLPFASIEALSWRIGWNEAALVLAAVRIRA